MINLVKTDEGAYPTFKTDGAMYAIPFEHRWRRIGTYDCPQLCEGCGFLTNTVYQHASSRASIACNVACAEVARERQSKRDPEHSAYLSIWMRERAEVNERLARLVERNLAHPPPLVVARRKTPPSRLYQRWGRHAVILDVTSRGSFPWQRVSPLWPHGDIPVPHSPRHTSLSVEGAWQGLKVFLDGRDVDTGKFSISSMRGLKRRGHILGHREGVEGERLLSYVEARRLLYLPTYRWVIEHCLQEELGTLIRLRAGGLTLVLLDYTTNGFVESEGEPLSHAMLLKHYIDARWILAGIRPYLPHMFEQREGEDNGATRS
jgi:hypothetical protein